MATPVDAILVYGSRLYYGTDGVNYTEFADMKSIGTPGNPKAPEVDVTPLADSADFRQFRLGLSKAGEMLCKQFFNSTRHATLDGIKRTKLYWRVRLPTSTTVANCAKLEFQGWLADLAISDLSDPDVPITSDWRVVLTGAVTFTAGS